MLSDEHILALRSRFPILREKTYLYNCSQGALSDAAEAGMQAFLNSWRSSPAPWNDWVESYQGMREEFARFINAEPDEVAVVTSASAGINVIANAMDFSERPNVVMGEYEFPTMGQIWLAQRPRGADIRFLDAVKGEIPLSAYERAVDRQTAIVPLTQVSFLNGFRSDVAGVTRLAHERGALVFLDGYQDCGTRPVDVKKLDVDFYVTGTLKYLLAPPGLAFLYVRRSLIQGMNPTLTSWMAQRDVFAFDTQTLDPASEARRFEGGSPTMPSIYAARPALQLLSDVGMQNVADQIAHLSRKFLAGLRDLRIACKTPASSVGPLVVVRSANASELVNNLTAKGVLVSPRLDGVRFSFHVYNHDSDVTKALSALEENIHLTARE